MGHFIAAAFAIGSFIYNVGEIIYDIFKKVNTAVTTLLDVIHFDTIMRLNDIAVIVSSDYRDLMNKVYTEISEFSSSVGFGAQGIALLLENTRKIVLDVSAMSGHRYDLANVVWLGELNRILTTVSTQSRAIARNPVMLFEIMRDQVEKRRYQQVEDKFSKTFFDLANIITRADYIVQGVTLVRTDLTKLVDDLPQSIRDEVKPMLDGILDPFDNWIQSSYEPYRNYFEIAIVSLGQSREDQITINEDVIKRLLHPGDLIAGIDGLSEDERIDQENKIGDVAGRSFNREMQPISNYIGEQNSEMRRITAALKVELPPPVWFKGELQGTIDKRPVQIASGENWFKGDY